MKTLQRLNKYQALRAFDIETQSLIDVSSVIANNEWVVTSGNASLVVTGDNYFHEDMYLLQLKASNTSPITVVLPFIESNSPFDSNDIGQTFAFTCVLKNNTDSVLVDASLANRAGESIESNSRDIQGGIWGAVRSNRMTLSSLNYTEDDYAITLTITGHSAGSSIYISNTNLVNDNVWANNPVIQSMRNYIPNLYERYDSQEIDPTWPFFRFVDVLTDGIADTMFTYSEWFEHYQDEISVDASKSDVFTRSRLTNYQFVREENLNWLAQFSGASIRKQMYSGNTPIVSDTAAFKTWQLYPSGYGRGAGTQSAIMEAAQFVLTGNKEVVVSQRHNDDPWQILISTIASETPDVDYVGAAIAASTINVNINTGLEPGDSIDGITLSEGDWVLLKNQTTSSQNGIYEVQASGAALRIPNALNHGSVVCVTQGTENGDSAFYISTSDPIVVGVDPIVFAEYPGSDYVLTMVEPTRPMGYKIYHTVVDKFTLTLGSSTFGVLGTATL